MTKQVADPVVKCKQCDAPMVCIYILDIPNPRRLTERRTERSYLCRACGKAAVDLGKGAVPEQAGSFAKAAVEPGKGAVPEKAGPLDQHTYPKAHEQSLRHLRVARKGLQIAKQGQ